MTHQHFHPYLELVTTLDYSNNVLEQHLKPCCFFSQNFKEGNIQKPLVHGVDFLIAWKFLICYHAEIPLNLCNWKPFYWRSTSQRIVKVSRKDIEIVAQQRKTNLQKKLTLQTKATYLSPLIVSFGFSQPFEIRKL